MASSIKIKVGALEVEYQGEESYLTKVLPVLIEKLVEVSKHLAPERPASLARGGGEGAASTDPPKYADLTIDEIASRTSGTKGVGLVVSGAAWLTFHEGKTIFSRKDLLAAMKQSAHYQGMDRSNLSRNLKALLKAQRLRKTAEQQYGLTATERTSVESALAA